MIIRQEARENWAEAFFLLGVLDQEEGRELGQQVQGQGFQKQAGDSGSGSKT